MLILLTGGSACGKSTYGEKLAVQGQNPCTISPPCSHTTRSA